jgi:hypothetical protein
MVVLRLLFFGKEEGSNIIRPPCATANSTKMKIFLVLKFGVDFRIGNTHTPSA